MAEAVDVIEFKDGRYFSALWFVAGEDKDWLAALYRDDPMGPWFVHYRFHYFADDIASWKKLMIPAIVDEAGILKSVNAMAAQVSKSYSDADVHKILLRSDRAQANFAAIEGEKFLRVETFVS